MGPEQSKSENFDRTLLNASADDIKLLGQRLAQLSGADQGHLANVVGFLLRGDLSSALAIYSWDSDKRLYSRVYPAETLAEFAKAFGSSGSDFYRALKNR